MRENEASLECRCGSCRLVLCDPNIRYRAECLCCDCRQRALISASKRADNKLPAAVANYERGIDDYFFSNALSVDDASRKLLKFSKLRDDAYNTTAMSACCGTLMCGTHPVYDGKSISANRDSCQVNVPSTMDTQVVLFGCDFPADKYSLIQHRSEIPMLFSVYDELDHPAIIAMMAALTKPMANEFKVKGWTTFEALSAENEIEIDNSFYVESRKGKQSAG